MSGHINPNTKEGEEYGKLTPQDESISEILDSVPPEQKPLFQVMMASLRMVVRGGPETETAKQLTPEHISQYLSGAREAMQKDYQNKREGRIFALLVLLIIVIALGFVILVLKDTPDVMEKIIIAAGGFIAGIAGGYGFGKTKKDDE